MFSVDRNRSTVMIVAGEASGDLHASNLYLELKKLIPNVRSIGMGGVHMREAGIELRYDSSNIAIIGLDGLLKNYPKIHRALRLMQETACRERPDLLICVDYKEFNFKLARKAKACGIKVLFYVSPQVWAWRPGRVKKYGLAIDRMAVIFPFEVPFYEQHNIPVSYVGHPLAEKVHPSKTKQQALEQLELKKSQAIIGLLPGSRASEVKRLLPVMLAAGALLNKQRSGVSFVLIQASSIDDQQIAELIETSPLTVKVIKNQRYDAIQCCNAVLTTSGTATLEVALLEIPMVITYIVSPLTYIIGKLLVNIPYIGLPNIISGRKIVQEFIQKEASAENIAAELEKILNDCEYLTTILKDLKAVKEQLGAGGGTAKLAAVAAGMLGLENQNV